MVLMINPFVTLQVVLSFFKFRLTKQFVDPPHNRILELSDDMKEFIGFIMVVERCYDVICI